MTVNNHTSTIHKCTMRQSLPPMHQSLSIYKAMAHLKARSAILKSTEKEYTMDAEEGRSAGGELEESAANQGGAVILQRAGSVEEGLVTVIDTYI